MHHMDLIMSEDGVEEIGEGRNQTRPQGVGEVMDLGDYPVSGEVIRRPRRRPPTLVEGGGHSRAEVAQTFQIEYDRAADGRRHGWRRVRWRRGLLPLLFLRWSHGGRRERGD